MKRTTILLLAVLSGSVLYAQSATDLDSIPADTLAYIPEFSAGTAWSYIDKLVDKNDLWRSQNDSLRENLDRLLDHSIEPYDTTRLRLLDQDFKSIGVQIGEPILLNSIDVKWLNDTTFLIDSSGWSASLYTKTEAQLIYPEKLSSAKLSDSTLLKDGQSDSILIIPDTILVTTLDTAALNDLGISLHNYSAKRVSPPLTDGPGDISPRLSADSSKVLYYSTNIFWEADENSPFHVLSNKFQLDSLQYAMETLLRHNLERDSTLLYINDINGNKTPFWLGSENEEAYRFWVKNFNNDSITIWLGSPGTKELSLLLEDDVNFNRLIKEDLHHLPTFVRESENTLLSMKMLEPEPIFWDFGFQSAFILNQTYLSNWTKGGESSFSTMMDLQSGATYNNKDANTQWINTARLKFGTIQTQEKGFRKNHDEFEINSKLNRNAWGKIGMSASFYMKHQLAKGYDYPNDSIPVSKFLNPGTMTIGLGFEYKPIKDMNFNLAPLSYKTTFVMDTANIDQTLHGVDADQWAKREMGLQLVLSSKVTPFENMDITNNLRLFSNYLNHPENIDIDWEVIVNQKINWFFNIRLNLHLIYDDDVRFPVLDENDDPVMLPDGSEKKVAKMQFKEFVGLSLQFKF